MKEFCEIKEAVKLVEVANSDHSAVPAVGEIEVDMATSSSAVSTCASSSVNFTPSPAFASGSASPSAGPIHKPSAWYNFSQRAAISSIVVGSLMTYLVIYLLSGHLFWHLTGVQTNDYVYATVNACGIGLVLTAVCYMEFLHRFVNLKNSIFGLFASVAAALFVAGSLTEGLQGVWVTLACCLAALVTGKLAQQARQAIPSSFRYGRAVLISALASLPAAFVSIFTFAAAAADTSTAPVVFSNSVCGDEIAAGIALFVFLAVPAYAFARCARTSEAKPLIALGFLQMSPLIIGVLAQLILLSSAGNAVALATSGITALACAAICVAWGSSAGALVNGLRHRRKMSKA